MRRPSRAATWVIALTGTVTALAGTTPPATGAGDGAGRYGDVWNILPPGQSGTVTATDLATVMTGGPDRTAVDGENAPENFADQLEMYDALTTRRPSSLTRADLDTLYKRESFRPDKVVREATPEQGVRIQWDQYGVPYVHGDTYTGTMFGAGWAGTKDRMFLMDVLRHAGRARLAEFAGATEDNLAMDRTQLRTAFYTEKEAQRQMAAAAERYGARGRKVLRGADAFIAGINAAQEQMCPHGNVLAPSCPAEYAALQKTPKPWTRADVVYVASLVGGIFGKGGGHEYANAIWLQRLVSRFGPVEGRQIYDDLREKNDLDAPTTAGTFTPYGGSARVHPQRPGVALPDVGGETAPGTGDPVGDSSPLPDLGTGALTGTAQPLRMDTPIGRIDVPVVSHGMSNALVVGGEHTTTGRPMTVFGPQTGYYTPQLLTEEVLVGPSVKARGVAFAGTNLVVQLGRGVDYAWSATSASNDNVDTVVERLCNTDGSKPTVHSLGYRVDGTCRPMQRYEHSYTAVPSAASPQAPQQYTYLVLRTRHGIVQTRTTVDGKPVAIVLQRSTYGHEVDSVAGFSELNDPGFVHGAASFQRAVSDIDYTFNWFYTDDRDISYFSSGRLPIRARGVDYDLPRWGDRRYDWQGWLPFSRHVHETNPPRGYFVSWNNKTAPGFAAADDVWGYGSVYRSLALERRLRRAVADGRKVGVADVTAVMSGAATEDTRARYTLPWLLKVVGDDPRTADARAVLRRWLRADAPRVDRDRDGHYGHEQAIAIFDDWWQHGRKSVAYDAMAGRLGERLAHRLPTLLDDHPRIGRGSAWNGIAWYGYLNKDLRTLVGDPVRQEYSRGYCGGGDLRECRQDLRASLRAAVARVLREQGVDRVSQLTYDKSQDDIRSVTVGVVGVRPIDWQNRPTFQQVVAFSGHRPR
ncbi:MAG TPA: penicillin acylase family protein [Nocardioidaceae bacterium]